MKKGPAPVARRTGGMRSVGLSGELDSERLEQQAMQGAAQAKSQQQQGALASGNNSGQSTQSNSTQKKTQPRKPRQVSSFKQELAVRPAQDIKREIKSVFDLNSILGINQEADTPEEIARKKKLHQRWQQLTQAEQKVARDKYQKELKKKQEEEKRRQIENQKQEEAKQKTIAPPASVSKRPGLFVGGKTGKKKAQNRLQQQRKTMGTMGSPN